MNDENQDQTDAAAEKDVVLPAQTRRPMLPSLNDKNSAASVESARANKNRRGAELPEE